MEKIISLMTDYNSKTGIYLYRGNSIKHLDVIFFSQITKQMHDVTNGQKCINKLEHDLANRASYHDALLNLESLIQSGKMHLCNL